jgi:hypothetical protein
LRNKRNQQVLSWLGGGLVVAATGLWAAFVYFSPAGKPPSIQIQSGPGGIAIGGHVTGAVGKTCEGSRRETEGACEI